MKPYKPSPEAAAAADRIVTRALAWQEGKLPDGKPLPWNIRLYAWFTSKIGLNVYVLQGIHKRNSRWGVCKVIAKHSMAAVNARLRLW